MRRSISTVLKIAGASVVVIAIGIGWFAWRLWPDEQGRMVPVGEKVNMTALPAFTKTLARATQIIVFEGLPHQNSKRSERESERRLKKCVEMHGYLFYDDARPAAHEDFTLLREALLRKGGIIEWTGNKLCGGYHPDYLIRWTGDDGTYDALICFGCHEVKLFGPRTRLYADLSADTYEQLKHTLAAFQKHRPMME